MISYYTNWMGPIGMWWFRKNGYTRLACDKEDDTREYEEITEHWCGGRIDIYGTDKPYGDEIRLPIMDGPSFSSFSKWLNDFETETVWSLNQLVTEYEKTHDKIRWHDEQK